MNKKIILMLFALIILAAVGGLFFLNNDDKSDAVTTGKLAAILSKGELVVGLDATYAPLEFVDNNGNIVGLDVDISNEIAKDLGVKLVFKNIAWNDLFDAIRDGSIDISVSSISITAERAKTLGFSDPYFNAGQVIVSLASSSTKIHGPEDLKELRIGAQINTTSDNEAKKYASKPELIHNFEEYSFAVDDILAGKIDAIIIDYPAAINMVAENKQLAIMGDIFTQEFYGVVTQKGEDDLILRINKIIRRLKQDGILQKIEDKWMPK